MAQIHQNIRRAREMKEMTQSQVAEKLFVTRQTVSSYESGRTRPDLETLKRLAEIMDVPLEQLLYGKEHKGGRQRLNRVVITALNIYLLMQLAGAIMLCAINNFVVVPGLFESGMVVVGEEIAPLIERRQMLLTVQSSIAQLAAGLFNISLVVFLVLDLKTKPAERTKNKILFLLSAVMLNFLLVAPWSLFDQGYQTVDYMFASLPAIMAVTLLTLVDIIICTVRSFAARRSS